MRGVLDRIEDGIAVILVEESDEQFTVSKEELPPGSKEGTWFLLEHDGNKFQIKHIDEQTTKAKEEKVKDLFQQLQSRKKKSKFTRK